MKNFDQVLSGNAIRGKAECFTADNSAGGAGFDWGQFLSGIENTAVTIAKTVTAPSGVQYNPQSGSYTPIPGTAQAGVASLTNNAPLYLLLGFGLIAILLLRK